MVPMGGWSRNHTGKDARWRVASVATFTCCIFLVVILISSGYRPSSPSRRCRRFEAPFFIILGQMFSTGGSKIGHTRRLASQKGTTPRRHALQRIPSILVSNTLGGSPGAVLAATGEPKIQCSEDQDQRVWSHCVSSAALLQPSRYITPWLFAPRSAAVAAEELASVLRPLAVAPMGSKPVAVTVSGPLAGGSWAVHAELPALVRASNVPGHTERDILDVLLRNKSGIATIRAVGFEDGLAYPPFCLTFGCINGPQIRSRLETLRRTLGWAADEPPETYDGWQPIFFNGRVSPYFDDQ